MKLDYNNIDPKFMEGLLYAINFFGEKARHINELGGRAHISSIAGDQLAEEYDRIQAERSEATKAAIRSER